MSKALYNKDFTLKDLEEFLEGLNSSKITSTGVFMVNEGNGYIPVRESKLFDKAMRDSVIHLKKKYD